MKKQKIADTLDDFLVSSNNYEDDDCSVCRLMKKVEKEGREPTAQEISIAIKEAQEIKSKSMK